MKFAEILVQHAYSRKQERFTYSVPEAFTVKRGDGVLVPFQKGEKLGLILKVHEESPSFAVKAIHSVLEPQTLLQEWQVSLAEWISEYYFCSFWDSIRMFLPKNLFIKSRKKAATNKIIAQKETPLVTLTSEQESIVTSILKDKPPVSLIHGVTGSGKTEIYKRLIEEKRSKGGQSLLLVPEISLTPQFIHYFKSEFPDMAVVHSRISEGDRTEQWKKIQSGEIKLVLGSRSSIFSPFKNLQLMIMDEEHEWSYKQDQSPRYHSRDVLLKIQELSGAQLIFGSATPSIETRYLAEQGPIRLYTLKDRVLGTPQPKIKVIDMRDELKKKNFSIVSDELEQKISSTLAKKEQVLLFLNRRGSASSTLCRDCGKACECKDCHTFLTYHAHNFRRPQLVCHHCGNLAPLPETCPSCGSVRIKQLGVGTEKVESELQKLFPLARIARADKDTMSKKASFSDLHRKMKAEEVDILIGTQMIGKGWDLPKVTLVGILLADLGLSIPDFRSSERGFQLLTQVAGRAGRRETQGEVLIQTYNPTHPVIEAVTKQDYDSFYEQEKCSRKELNFPPFSKLAKVMLIENTEKEAQQKAQQLQKQLEDPAYQIFSAPAFISRVKGKHQWNLLIQGPCPRQLLNKLENSGALRIDIDPMVSI